MRNSVRSFCVAAVAPLLAGMLLVAAGCTKHEDFPDPLAIQPVPTPVNFVITQPDPDVYDYDFTWSIDDPAGVVDFYRIYLLGSEFAADELLGETQQTSFLVTFPFSVQGLRFAVSAVSSENVEGSSVARDAP